MAELLAHDVGVGVVGGDSEEICPVGDHSHQIEKCPDATKGVFADDGGEGLMFGGVELAQINTVAHGAKQALKRGTFFKAIEPLLCELEPPTFLFHLYLFFLSTDKIMWQIRTQEECLPGFKLYRFITDEGKAFAFYNVGDFYFRVVVPIIVKNGRKILPSLLCQYIAVITTVLFCNTDVFNGGFHSYRYRLTKCT